MFSRQPSTGHSPIKKIAMGFQSDIYLGFAGKNEIVREIGTKPYKGFAFDEAGARELEDHFVEDVVPRDVCRSYLKEKYGWPVNPALKAEVGINEVFIWEQEGEDIGEENHLYGVKLTNRYFPAFLDFRESSGGLYLKKFDKQLLADIEWVRSYLVNEAGLKHYQNAEILVLDKWY